MLSDYVSFVFDTCDLSISSITVTFTSERFGREVRGVHQSAALNHKLLACISAFGKEGQVVIKKNRKNIIG